MIKFEQKLSNFKYILAFDLAKIKTGWSLIDFREGKIVKTGMLDMGRDVGDEGFWAFYAQGIASVFNKVEQYLGETIVTKERCPSQGGKFSTIATLQSLAQAHAIFDMVCYTKNVNIYDEIGVHSVSVKSYFKKLTEKTQPTKQDIAKCIAQIFEGYDFGDLSLDITDSIGVALTLLNVKWDADIKARVKEIKKEQKSAVSDNKIKNLQENIQRLEGLLSEKSYCVDNVE